MRRILDRLFSLIEMLCKIFLVVQVLACAVVFVGRYFIGHTPAWADPVALLCMVWLCILSSALAVRNDSHLRISVIDAFAPSKILRALNILAVLTVLVVAIFLLYAGGQLTMLATRNRITGLGIPTAWMTAVLPITGAVYLAALLDRWRRRRP